MLSKTDFLKGICGDSVEFEIENVGSVLLRSLTVKELRNIATQYTDDEIGAATATLLYGLVDPALDKEDIVYLEKATPGIIMKLAKRIQELSGLVPEDTDSPN